MSATAQARRATLPPVRACFTASLLALSAYYAAPAAALERDTVSLTESTIAWSTAKYAVTEENGFVDGSLDTKTIVDRTFRTWVLENRYLKVTLLPEFGGRILSIIYKPTGHEQLYRTEVGVPYGMKGRTFYYDWMMVYGGIFPTLPDAEHGKTWLKPWEFQVVKQAADEVTVSMSLNEDFSYSAAPPQFRRGASGIAAAYHVTLKAGRAALDTHLVLKSTRGEAFDYEYWTCATFAPGSDPKQPKATAGAEIIAPIATYTTPTWSANIAEGDERLGDRKSRFEKLRHFRNWPTMGIAYAAPDMQGGNFWGVINHDNEEGIIRIADNKVTPGLKMWTWGFPSLANAANVRSDPRPDQPYVELWAGMSDQFFHPARFPASGEVQIVETWSPTVGMGNVTHASDRVLVNLSASTSAVTLQFVSIEPDTPLRLTLKRGETALFDEDVKPDPAKGNRVSAALVDGKTGETIRLTIRAADGKELIAAETQTK